MEKSENPSSTDQELKNCRERKKKELFKKKELEEKIEECLKRQPQDYNNDNIRG